MLDQTVFEIKWTAETLVAYTTDIIGTLQYPSQDEGAQSQRRLCIITGMQSAAFGQLGQQQYPLASVSCYDCEDLDLAHYQQFGVWISLTVGDNDSDL